MPRYYFHIFDGKVIPDSSGTLLRGDSEVRIHMLALASTWIGLERSQKKHWSLEARDENENLIGAMSFGTRPNDA